MPNENEANIPVDDGLQLSHEDFGKVCYAFGLLMGMGELNDWAKKADWDEIALECENITLDWQRFKNIKDEEEEGYPIPYAIRIFREKFGKESKNISEG